MGFDVNREFCIAKDSFASRHWLLVARYAIGVASLLLTSWTGAQKTAPADPPGLNSTVERQVPGSLTQGAASTWVAVPRLAGRLRAKDIGLVINTADPYSTAVGEYYAQKRGLLARQVLRLELPVKTALSEAEFKVLEDAVNRYFGDEVQALALAWTAPSAVGCNSITGALALGYDGALCTNTCAASRPSAYANSPTARPFTELRMRPSMLLAARSVEQARAMVDRGVASDHTARLLGAPTVQAVFVETNDPARNVRAALYPPPADLRRPAISVRRVNDGPIANSSHVVLVQTGTSQVPWLPSVDWAPGALGDHLTSWGGRLDGKHDHTTVLDWIESGATASHGIVSEPCNHLQKFPHPQWLLLWYVQGATAIEAYWKSVRWPQQSLFVGEPLAAPFAPREP